MAYIRECYAAHLRRREVYEKFKDKITFGSFARVWDGSIWKDIKPEVYTEENKEYYRKHSTDGAKSEFAAFTEEEVISFRKRYVKETAKNMFPEVKDRITYDGFQKMLWGYTYPDLPLYKKKEKKWINVEACNDYPL